MTKIEELRAAYEAATGGEWGQIDGYVYKNKTNIAIAQCFVTTSNLNKDEVKNAHFIALAHNNMPALLEAVEALENLVICPAFNGQVFERDKESHRAWTLARAALEKLK